LHRCIIINNNSNNISHQNNESEEVTKYKWILYALHFTRKAKVQLTLIASIGMISERMPSRVALLLLSAHKTFIFSITDMWRIKIGCWLFTKSNPIYFIFMYAIDMRT
jgi:hypothetical protein